MEKATLKIIIMSLVISMLFPIFAYTFATFTGDYPSDYDITLTTEKLLNAGILLKDGEIHNITFANSTYTQFDYSNHSVRVRWYNDAIWGDRFWVVRQSVIEKLAGTWFFPEGLNYIINGVPYATTNLDNLTIINNWDSEYNWTKVEIPDEGSLMLFETLVSDDNNITKAIYETGTVTVTVGSQAGTGFTFDSFIDWYWGVLVTGNDFGMPTFMSWLIKLLSAYMVLGALLLGRELLPT